MRKSRRTPRGSTGPSGTQDFRDRFCVAGPVPLGAIELGDARSGQAVVLRPPIAVRHAPRRSGSPGRKGLGVPSPQQGQRRHVGVDPGYGPGLAQDILDKMPQIDESARKEALVEWYNEIMSEQNS